MDAATSVSKAAVYGGWQFCLFNEAVAF